jgi:ubiquitin-protein ligase
MTSSSPTSQSLTEEIEAINAIYGPSTLALSSTSNSTSATSPASTTAVLALPNTPISFRLSFPSNYPNSPPSIKGTETTHDLQKGEGTWAVGVLRDVLERIWKEGEVCLFDLIEEASPLLETTNQSDEAEDLHHENNNLPTSTTSTTQPEAHDLYTQNEGPRSLPLSTDPIEPPWVLSDPFTEKKSLFLARACHCTSVPLAQEYLNHLLTTNKRVRMATHNISAWRIRSQPAIAQDYDSDGETAAGSRLLHLLQLMDVWDVVVVVSRWYGGVKLGPDRFRIINSVAREVLVKGSFAGGGEGKEGGQGHGHGKTRGKGKKG